MSNEYPMCEKLSSLGDQVQGIMEFMDYLSENGYLITEYKKYDDCDEEQIVPVTKSRETLAHECYGIDEKQLEKERQAMLDEMLNA